jgi:hypothetical protein
MKPLTVYPLPVVNDVTIIQCDDLNAITSFNLTVKTMWFQNSANETFSYYESVDSDGNLQDQY